MKLIHGDCLKEMFDIPDSSVDMVCCDMPYGTTACKWDTVLDLGCLWWHYNRVIKKTGAIVLFSAQPFTTTLIQSNVDKFKYQWVWKKSKGSNFPHAPNMPLKITEDICVFSNGIIGHVSQAGERRMPYNPQGITPGKTVVKQNKNTSELKYHRDSQTNHSTGYKCRNENYPTCIIEAKSEGKTVHPTQKPVALIEYLIKTYTNEGDSVLDNCMGSGTTGVACLNTERDFIGIELDEKYFEIAKQRIEGTQYNQQMQRMQKTAPLI